MNLFGKRSQTNLRSGRRISKEPRLINVDKQVSWPSGISCTYVWCAAQLMPTFHFPSNRFTPHRIVHQMHLTFHHRATYPWTTCNGIGKPGDSPSCNMLDRRFFVGSLQSTLNAEPIRTGGLQSDILRRVPRLRSIVLSKESSPLIQHL